MREARGTDWRTILLAIGAVGGALFSLASIALTLVLDAASSLRGGTTQASRSPLDTLVLVSALLVIGAVFLPGAYYSIQRMRGLALPESSPRLLKAWQGIALIIIWLAAAFGAEQLLQVPVVKWVAPLLYVLAIGIPVYFFVRLATGGIEEGSRQRSWGVLAAGIGLGTTLALTAELLLALLGIVVLFVYISLHPERLFALRQLSDQLMNSSSPEQALNLLTPWINNPLAAALALLFFSILSPLIEETSKSLAIWTVFDRLSSPAQGFALGAISGAAFGLVESLLVSANPGANWTVTLLVRGASTMMHIMAASLTGWGIASFRLSKRPSMLVGMYLAAMGLHATWNASVVAVTFGGLRTAAVPNGRDLAGMALIAAGVGVLVILCLAIPAGLAVSNWQFRKPIPETRAQFTNSD